MIRIGGKKYGVCILVKRIISSTVESIMCATVQLTRDFFQHLYNQNKTTISYEFRRAPNQKAYMAGQEFKLVKNICLSTKMYAFMLLTGRTCLVLLYFRNETNIFCHRFLSNAFYLLFEILSLPRLCIDGRRSNYLNFLLSVCVNPKYHQNSFPYFFPLTPVLQYSISFKTYSLIFIYNFNITI